MHEVFQAIVAGTGLGSAVLLLGQIIFGMV